MKDLVRDAYKDITKTAIATTITIIIIGSGDSNRNRDFANVWMLVESLP